MLLIEHDMDLVFTFADRISVLVNGALFVEGAPTRSRAIRASRRSISARRSMPELLRIERLTAGYGEAVVLSELSLTLAEGQSLALLGRNGMGKTTLVNSIVGVTRYIGGTIMLDGPTEAAPTEAAPAEAAPAEIADDAADAPAKDGDDDYGDDFTAD